MKSVQARWLSFSAAPHRLFCWMGSLFAVISVFRQPLQQASLHSGQIRPIFWGDLAVDHHRPAGTEAGYRTAAHSMVLG